MIDERSLARTSSRTVPVGTHVAPHHLDQLTGDLRQDVLALFEDGRLVGRHGVEEGELVAVERRREARTAVALSRDLPSSACCVAARTLGVRSSSVGPRHSRRVVDVDDITGGSRVGDELVEQPPDVVGQRLTAGLALRGVVLRHPDADLFVELRIRTPLRQRLIASRDRPRPGKLTERHDGKLREPRQQGDAAVSTMPDATELRTVITQTLGTDKVLRRIRTLAG